MLVINPGCGLIKFGCVRSVSDKHPDVNVTITDFYFFYSFVGSIYNKEEAED